MSIFSSLFYPSNSLIRELADHVRTLLHKVDAMAASLDELTSRVAEIETVGASVVALLGELKTQLDEAGVDPVALQALSDRLGAESAVLAQAVLDNTPAADTEDPVDPQV